MFENFTTDQIFRLITKHGVENILGMGRVAIIDDPVLEKAWDTFVQAYSQIQDKYVEWVNTNENLPLFGSMDDA